MKQISRPIAVAAASTLSALAVLLVPADAAADTARGATKAGIEHSERMAAGADGLSKAQIEQREREQSTSGGGARQQPAQPSPSSSNGSGAAAWQLALGATLGAVLAGGVVVASRQVTHRHAVAS